MRGLSAPKRHASWQKRAAVSGTRCLHPLAVTSRRITELCTCLLHSKTMWAASETLAQLIPREVRLCLEVNNLTLSQLSHATVLEREARESVMYQHTRVCTPFPRDPQSRDQQSIASMFRHRWFVQSFKEVRAECGINSVAPPLTATPLDQRSSLLAISE